jgi:MFS family permease
MGSREIVTITVQGSNDSDQVPTVAPAAPPYAADPGPLLYAVGPEALAQEAGPPAPARLGRLGPLLLLNHAGWALPSTAAGTLLQALLAEERPGSKVASYAVITSVGAAAAVLSTVVAGALSDRTRSRFGRRNPWILGGALAASASLATSGLTSVFALQILCFALYQAGLSAMLSPLGALLPDRVPKTSLGRASALSGVGYLLGTALGGVAASAAINVPAVGIRLVPWTMLAAALLLFFLARDVSNAEEPREPLDRRGLLRSFLPSRDRDVLWAFTGRFCVILALFMVVFYQLYLLTDYLHLSSKRASEVIALGSVLLAVVALLATSVAGVLSDRLERRKPLVVAASVLIAASALPALVEPSVPSVLAFYVIGGFGYGMYLSVDQALMVEVLPTSGTEAKDLGFLSIANTAPLVLGPPLSALLVTLLGYRALFAVTFLLALVGALCILMIRRVR